MTTEGFLKKHGHHKFFNDGYFSFKGIETHSEGTDSFIRGIATTEDDTVYFQHRLNKEVSN
jgi:hypothetical protein